MSNGRHNNNQVASSVPFDNTDTDFESTNVQDVLEEIGTTASPPFSFGRSGNNSSGTWMQRVGGAPSNRSGVNVGFSDPKLVKVNCNTEDANTYELGIYQHQGDEINLTLITTVSIISSRNGSFLLDVPLTEDWQLGVRIESGSAKNIGVDITLGGKS